MFGDDDNQYANDNNQTNAVAEPATDNSGYNGAPAVDNTQPVNDATVPAPAIPEPATTSDDLLPMAPSNDLLAIKQQALQQLSPLVGHLDQSPEEKFRTTMMMIQASDDQSMIKTAYEAAQQIPDEKEKAQALLDIVNEINYFTQHQNTETS